MRWLVVMLGMLLLLGSSPGLVHLVVSNQHHDCGAAEDRHGSCPEEENGCAGEVHTCMCHAWPAFLASAHATEIETATLAAVIRPAGGRFLVPEEHRMRIERPPQGS
jgi:hypothetical protein